LKPAATPSRPLDGFFFEDYRVGQRFRHATPRTITSGDVALYIALTGARQPLHCASTVAKALGYPESPVDDLLVFHIAFGKTVPDISYNAVANLGYADCRFLLPVFVGDTIRCETEIVGLKQNSNGKTGVVYVRSNAFNQRDENVLTWARWVMVHRRKADAPNEHNAPQGQVDFAASVAVDAIRAPEMTNAGSVMNSATDSDVMWEDVNVFVANASTLKAGAPQGGKLLSEMTEQEIDSLLPEGKSNDPAPFSPGFKPINHPAGMTIEESDHMLATRLYQNTARVHFDLHHMKDSRFGKRLIYGGHIISLCRALAYDGLENVISIAAINSGTHNNPTFAGDTIYAISLPIAKWVVNNDVGAVRVILTGYKNVNLSTRTSNSASFNSSEDEAKVLSLDYTVLMPRRANQ
jgi:2-methylfumaryl-CoA hydratase